MLSRKIAIYMGVALVVLTSACTLSKQVKYDVTVPAEMKISGIKKVAVAEFDGIYQSGRIIQSKILSGMLDGGEYKIFEREKLNEILQENELAQAGILDPSTVNELKLAGVDALIFGVVDAYSVSDQRGTSKSTKKVGTGEYRKVEYKDRKTKETKYREEEIKKTITWDRPYVLRQGTIGVTFRMTNISTGEVVVVEALTETFRDRRWTDDQTKTFSTKEEILNDLASKVVRNFLRKIQTHTLKTSLVFEQTSNPHSKLGVKFARAELWSRALREFTTASYAEPDDAASYYNIGLCQFILGDFESAERNIDMAIDLNPKSRYINALSMIEKKTRRR